MPQYTPVQLSFPFDEEWRPVPGYEGWYEVSSYGHIRRVARDGRTRPGHVLCADRSTYRKVTLSRGERGGGRCVHHLVAEAFLGPRPAGMQVNHKDLNKWNNRLDNLEYVTAQGNRLHAQAGGAGDFRGERSPNAKLTDQQVAEIRALRAASGLGYMRLAARYGVSVITIRRVLAGQSYRPRKE